jgi:selenocysteine lyase/cysteine desulfurase
MPPLRVAVVGDFDLGFAPHPPTNEALPHSAAALGLEVEVEWAATAPLEEDLGPIEHVDAIVCAPGSPYRSLLGAVEALRFARQSGLPSLGTCGGCQHMIIEYARNVLGFEDAQHAEYDPYSSQLFVSELACSVAGQTMPVNLEPGSRASRVYGAERVEEQYYCNFGLNPDYRQVLDGGGFRIVGVDDDDEVRVLELPQHAFYVADPLRAAGPFDAGRSAPADHGAPAGGGRPRTARGPGLIAGAARLTAARPEPSGTWRSGHLHHDAGASTIDRMPDSSGAWSPAAGYLDTAAYGLPPRATLEAMRAWLEQWERGRTHFSAWLQATDSARSDFARLLEVPASSVATGASASQLIGVVAASLPDRARVLVPEGEFSSLLFPLLVQHDRGVRVSECPLEQLAERVSPAFDLVAFSLVSSATGRAAPFEAIVSAAERAGVPVLVDAAQACGWLVTAWDRFDYVVCPAFKWLSCPRGVAFLVVRPERMRELRPQGAGWYATEGGTHFYGSPPALAADARRLDISPSWPSFAGAAPALRLLAARGAEELGTVAAGLANRFRGHVGLPPEATPIVTLSEPGVAERMRAAGLVVSARPDGARLAFHHYNSESDADRAAEALVGMAVSSAPPA